MPSLKKIHVLVPDYPFARLLDFFQYFHIWLGGNRNAWKRMTAKTKSMYFIMHQLMLTSVLAHKLPLAQDPFPRHIRDWNVFEFFPMFWYSIGKQQNQDQICLISCSVLEVTKLSLAQDPFPRHPKQSRNQTRSILRIYKNIADRWQESRLPASLQAQVINHRD